MLLSRRALVLAAGPLLLLSAGCERRTPEPSPSRPAPGPDSTLKPSVAAAASPPASGAQAATLSPALTRPAPARLVAVGDLHGDLETTRKALRLAGAIDAKDAWVGGRLVLVQTGDAIDRDDGDRSVLDLLAALRTAAEKAGGELIALAGNHEIMNVALDFRYVTRGGFAAFADVKPQGLAMSEALGRLQPAERGRASAFAPGGPYAVRLADEPVVVKVGETVFVHGGLFPKHVSYGLDRMNDEMHAFMRGTRGAPPPILVAEDGPVWTRAYSETPGKDDCEKAAQVLASLGARRMVVGHTPQRAGISSACDDRVWRIDVGLSHYYGGPLQVLQIEGDRVTVRKPEG